MAFKNALSEKMILLSAILEARSARRSNHHTSRPLFSRHTDRSRKFYTSRSAGRKQEKIPFFAVKDNSLNYTKMACNISAGDTNAGKRKSGNDTGE